TAFHQKEQVLNQKLELLQAAEVNDKTAIGALKEKVASLEDIKDEKQQLQTNYERLSLKNSELNAEMSALKQGMITERNHTQEKLAILEQAEKRLGTEFENIANKIFEQKSEKFTKTSETGLNHILSPLKTQLNEFKKQVNEHYVSEGKERASLRTEIHSLKVLNQRITEEAEALTQALKGDTKAQGNWGEIVLERLLEESGLRKGFEYDVQVSARNEEGKRFYPDVIVHLPNKKDVVIDSKVSLVAYEKLNRTDNSDEQKIALKQHIASMKTHIKGLSKKDYQALENIRTLDYVLMFVPIEAAFILAVEEEPDLIKLALENQIMIVSPTNLLVALRTIHNIWQYEYQHENAAKIADQAKKLYDKFVGFITDMEKVSKQLELASTSHESAMNKLHSGRGNIVRQLENFKTLGVNPNKSIDSKYVDDHEQ
ncbi:MAG: DNA recombination protein RmuC, partial [Pseudomonadota bacterium]